MEKIGFWSAIVLMWKRCFDYAGKSNRREFWFPFLFQTLLVAIASIVSVLILSLKLRNIVLFIPVAILALYCLAAVLPWISLTVRRLHDTGRSGWWYCLVFAVGIGLVILMLMCATVGGTYAVAGNIMMEFVPDENMNEPVYGPPLEEESWEKSEAEEDSVPVNESSRDVPSTEDANTSEALKEEKSEESEDSEEFKHIEEIPFNPGENENVAVYGPPDMMIDRPRQERASE